jgi:hypothetical protein
MMSVDSNDILYSVHYVYCTVHYSGTFGLRKYCTVLKSVDSNDILYNSMQYALMSLLRKYCTVHYVYCTVHYSGTLCHYYVNTVQYITYSVNTVQYITVVHYLLRTILIT